MTLAIYSASSEKGTIGGLDVLFLLHYWQLPIPEKSGEVNFTIVNNLKWL